MEIASRITAATISFMMFVTLSGLAQEAATQRAAQQESARTLEYKNCSGSAKDCKPRVKFIGERDGCSCFACEYGKKNEHFVCTRDPEEKHALVRLEEHLNEKDEATTQKHHKDRKPPKNQD